MMYRIFHPIGLFRSLSFATEQLARWNFNGDHLFNEGYVQAEGQFINYWNFYVRAYIRAKQLSTTALRGGPAFKIESSHNLNYQISTDSRKTLQFSLEGGNFWSHDNFSKNYFLGLGSSWRQSDMLTFSLNPSYSYNQTDLHWVTALSYDSDTRYIFGRVKYNEFRIVFRCNYNITPNFTIQYYGQPFIGAGKFNRFSKITNPKADNYEDRFYSFRNNEISQTANTYSVDESSDGTIDYSFRNPDFNVKEFLSNLVIRWEYTPGSTFYLVWSQNRAGVDPTGEFALSNNLDSLYDIHPHNIFLMKVSHWFSF
jgi:hypothetical protein